MTNQKYCRNCGEPNLPDAKFCASCGKAFVSAAETPPLTAPSAKPSPDKWKTPWNQPSQSSQPRTVGVSRKIIVVGIVVLFILLTLGCVAVAVMTPNTPTPTPTVKATVAATATVKATASPTGTAMTDRLDTSFRNQGFTVVTPFTETRNQYGNLVYTGSIDDGDTVLQQYQHKLTIEVVSDRSNALTRFNAYKTAAINSGDYTPNTVTDTGWWHGWSDQRVSTWYSVKDVNININEPKSAVSFSRIFVTPVYVKGIYWDTYTISVDYATHK